jgi:hypothetical protein
MLLKYFNSNRISVIILISLLPVVYWIPSLFQGTSVQVAESAGIPLNRLITSFNLHFRLISSLFALALIIVNGYLLIQLNIIHIFIPVRTQLPSFFYVMLVIGMNQLHQLTPALVASTLLILVFYRIFNAYKAEGISINFLDAGLLISTASLIYFPSLLFFLFLLAGMAFLRPFNGREWTFAFLGLILPYIFLISVYYLADMPVKDYFRDITGSFIKATPAYKLSNIVNWSYVLLFMLISSLFMAGAIDNMKIHARKFFLVFLMFFLFSVLIFFILPGAGTGMVYFVSVPLTYLYSYYFIKCKRNWFNELFLLIFLLLLLWQRIN